VSTKFEEVKSPVQRHRLVHSILADELAGPVHALSIVAKSPLQWEKMVSDDQGNQHDTNNNTDTIVGPSPSCRGGDGSLPPRNPKP
jgi:BolA protein